MSVVKIPSENGLLLLFYEKIRINPSPDTPAEVWSCRNDQIKLRYRNDATEKREALKSLDPSSEEYKKALHIANVATFLYNKYPDFFGESAYNKAGYDIPVDAKYNQ